MTDQNDWRKDWQKESTETATGSEDESTSSQGTTGLGAATSGQVSGGGERSGAEATSATGETGQAGNWGNKSGSGSGGQGESDMDEPSTTGTNG